MMLLDIFQDLECTFGNTGKVWCKVYRYPRGIFLVGWTHRTFRSGIKFVTNDTYRGVR